MTARITDIKRMCESRRHYLQQCNVPRTSSSSSTSGTASGKSKPVGAVSPDGHKVIDFESPTASTSSEETGGSENPGAGSANVIGSAKHSLKLSPQVRLDFLNSRNYLKKVRILGFFRISSHFFDVSSTRPAAASLSQSPLSSK